MKRGFAGVLIALLLSGGATTVAAQTVRGTLVEYPSGNRLPRGRVTLLDTAGFQIDSTQTSAQGSFTLRATSPGTYALFFSHPGYASVPSGWIRLRANESLDYTFSVPLISGAALQRMSETIELERRLQQDLPQLCGEALRPEHAGIIVGVVRSRHTNRPVAGAVVRVEAAAPAGAAFRKATITSANGVYVMCNVPAGNVIARTEHAAYLTDEGPVQVRAGEIGWYDVRLKAR